MTSVHTIHARTIDGADKSLGDYAGKVLLVVNVASRCGLTPHYKGLEALHQSHGARGLEVLGFPCNQFGAQEPGTEADIKTFCESKYDVTFPMFAKLDVNGAGRHALYGLLTASGAGPTKAGDITWNFEKFVVDRRGEVVARFAPPTKPDAPELVATLEKALAG